jgi:hypothetical protein
MNTKRWVLISITFAITAFFMFQVYIWSEEFKHQFMYSNDFISYAMVFIFVIALTGIFKWFLKQEIKITNPKRRRRLK